MAGPSNPKEDWLKEDIRNFIWSSWDDMETILKIEWFRKASPSGDFTLYLGSRANTLVTSLGECFSRLPFGYPESFANLSLVVFWTGIKIHY